LANNVDKQGETATYPVGRALTGSPVDVIFLALPRHPFHELFFGYRERLPEEEKAVDDRAFVVGCFSDSQRLRDTKCPFESYQYFFENKCGRISASSCRCVGA